MIFSFWKEYEELLSYEQMSLLDYRLDNIVIKLNTFFQRLIISHIKKENIRFYLAGSCLKADTFNDLDMFFPDKNDMNLLNDAMNKDFFEYSNNSFTYRYKNDLYQLVFRDKYENSSLEELVSGFDFASTKIAFECNYNTIKRLFTITKCDMRKDFIMYINTRHNPLVQISINPIVSLQRAIYFTRKGDDVPFDTFLNIVDSISEMKNNHNLKEEDYLRNIQGNPNKLSNIKKAISDFIDRQDE
jgi:hypothetical protein